MSKPRLGSKKKPAAVVDQPIEFKVKTETKNTTSVPRKWLVKMLIMDGVLPTNVADEDVTFMVNGGCDVGVWSVLERAGAMSLWEEVVRLAQEVERLRENGIVLIDADTPISVTWIERDRSCSLPSKMF